MVQEFEANRIHIENLASIRCLKNQALSCTTQHANLSLPVIVVQVTAVSLTNESSEM